MISDNDFQSWLLDTRRTNHRLLLVEIDHSTGTLRFASDAWLDTATNDIYDDFLVSLPELEDTLGDFLGVGDIDVVNAVGDVDYLALEFRGHACRWYVGDDEWARDEFKQVVASIVSDCRRVNGRVHRFDLIDGGRSLEKTFTAVAYTFAGTVKAAIDDIMVKAGLPAVTYTNIPTERNFAVNVTFDDSSTVGESIKLIAGSIGAYVRYSQLGDIEVFRPDYTTPSVELTGDDIVRGSIQMSENIPAYADVVVNYTGGSVSGATTADTGEISEKKTIETVLSSVSDANTLLSELQAYHSTAHFVWDVKALNFANLMQGGTVVDIDDDELTGVALVTNLKRAPLSRFSSIEVTI